MFESIGSKQKEMNHASLKTQNNRLEKTHQDTQSQIAESVWHKTWDSPRYNGSQEKGPQSF